MKHDLKTCQFSTTAMRIPATDPLPDAKQARSNSLTSLTCLPQPCRNTTNRETINQEYKEILKHSHFPGHLIALVALNLPAQINGDRGYSDHHRCCRYDIKTVDSATPYSVTRTRANLIRCVDISRSQARRDSRMRVRTIQH